MRHTLAAVLVATSVASTIGAQMPVAAPTCTYDSCSLRLELFEVKRGAGNERVGRFGMFGRTAMTPLVLQTSDSAMAHARLFDREYSRGLKLTWAGLLITAPTLAALMHHSNGRDDFDGTSIALAGGVLVGTFIETIGTNKLRNAQKALSRALWWHNRELPR